MRLFVLGLASILFAPACIVHANSAQAVGDHIIAATSTRSQNAAYPTSDSSVLRSSATPSGGPRATEAQVTQLVGFQQWQFRTAPKSGAKADVSDCVARNIRNVDPGNPAWNTSDPRWAAVSDAIGQDCVAQHDRILKQVLPAMNSALRDSLAYGYRSRLSTADADALIGYYTSNEGRRFLDFQARLSRTIGFGMGKAFGADASRNGDKPPISVLKERVALLQLSSLFATQIATAEDERSTGRDTSAATVTGIMMVAVATAQGDSLDTIRREYSEDLSGFAAFVASPAEKRELRVFSDSNAAMVASATGPAKEMDPASNGSLQRWRDLYRSLPAGENAGLAKSPQ